MIDWKRVAELRSEIGADGFAEVADMFLEEAEQAVQELASGLDADAVEGQLHVLRGSALNLGFTELAALCHAGERKAALGEGAEVDAAAIARMFQLSRSLLESGLRQGNAA